MTEPVQDRGTESGTRWLERIESPRDLAGLRPEERGALCAEIRAFLLDSVPNWKC